VAGAEWSGAHTHSAMMMASSISDDAPQVKVKQAANKKRKGKATQNTKNNKNKNKKKGKEEDEDAQEEDDDEYVPPSSLKKQKGDGTCSTLLCARVHARVLYS
jgi:hypothetical protein